MIYDGYAISGYIAKSGEPLSLRSSFSKKGDTNPDPNLLEMDTIYETPKWWNYEEEKDGFQSGSWIFSVTHTDLRKNGNCMP